MEGGSRAELLTDQRSPISIDCFWCEQWAGKRSARRKLRQRFNEFLTRPSLFLIWRDHPDVVWCHRKMNYATELSQGQKR
jgi:hypothetical protein